jgi:hypothetical protein
MRKLNVQWYITEKLHHNKQHSCTKHEHILNTVHHLLHTPQREEHSRLIRREVTKAHTCNDVTSESTVT